jgi:hypothetical protein
MKYDLFICHASEDKDVIARPLKERLESRCYRVWFDEGELYAGDILAEQIARGLSQSRFVVPILSPAFIPKSWPRRELQASLHLEQGSANRIVPVWHGVSDTEVERIYSPLAGRLGIPTNQGVDHVAEQLAAAIRMAEFKSEAIRGHSPTLHSHSLKLLEAARKANGVITIIESLRGQFTIAGNVDFGDPYEPRTAALNRHCIDELERFGLVSPYGSDSLKVSVQGFDYTPPSENPTDDSLNPPEIDSHYISLAFAIMASAVQDTGRITVTNTSRGSFLSCGTSAPQESSDTRTLALWKAVLEELKDKELVSLTSRQSHSACYRVTHLGYFWTDFMKTLAQSSMTEEEGQTA